MKTPVTPQFLEETKRFNLRFSCSECVYEDTDSGGCSEGFPNASHRSRALLAGDEVVFCKRFEVA